MTTTNGATDSFDVSSLVSRVATLIGRSGGALTTGDLAELRRMDPRRPPAAFFKVEGLFLEAVLPGDADQREDLETRWAAIVAGLARLGDLHQPGRRLGTVLADAQYSELRFARLVRSDTDRLVDELPALARFLEVKGTAVDWSGAGTLMLSADGPAEERIRRHVARDYYAAVARRNAA